MSEQIIKILKRKFDDLTAYGELDAETRYNAFKEELQFYVLNFIYHHPKYSEWIMYGGSALRIIHGLDRMSVDLDFEISEEVNEKFLEELKKEIKNYFIDTYGAGDDFLKIKIKTGRGLLLKFLIDEELSSGHPSKQLHVKIDLNHFIAPHTVTERRPINRDQLSFVILTYNMSALMASKIAAIFLRGRRGVGEAFYEEKGRDIYDLLWYMNKKAIPDFDYLIAKKIAIEDFRTLFDKLTLQINKVSDTNLKNDLTPLFVNRNFIENWLMNWRESYLRLLDDYKIRTVTVLKQIIIDEDFKTDNYSFTYKYDTAEKKIVSIKYTITYEWVKFQKLFDTEVDEKIIKLAISESGEELNEPLKKLITLFSQKTENYFKKTKRIMLGDEINTKVIRMTAVNLNPNEQILLNNSTLSSCELDDLLK